MAKRDSGTDSSGKLRGIERMLTLVAETSSRKSKEARRRRIPAMAYGGRGEELEAGGSSKVSWPRFVARLEEVDAGGASGQLAATSGARWPRVLRWRAPAGLRVRAKTRERGRGERARGGGRLRGFWASCLAPAERRGGSRSSSVASTALGSPPSCFGRRGGRRQEEAAGLGRLQVSGPRLWAQGRVVPIFFFLVFLLFVLLW